MNNENSTHVVLFFQYNRVYQVYSEMRKMLFRNEEDDVKRIYSTRFSICFSSPIKMRFENLHFLIKILLIIHIAVVKWRGMTQIVGFLHMNYLPCPSAL